MFLFFLGIGAWIWILFWASRLIIKQSKILCSHYLTIKNKNKSKKKKTHSKLTSSIIKCQKKLSSLTICQKYSFGILLKPEPWCKFMLKHDIKNYFQQFTKTLSICFQWITTHKDLLMCNYFWLEKLKVCTKWRILSDKYIYWIKCVKYKKVFKIQSTGCYDVNVIYIISKRFSCKIDQIQFLVRF